ncbi:centrosomal protein of 112 kDa isoform X7 [Ornithorhynchus anatinus]|uniref:centrosomal protein of 112 kDa isoform X7 n=1 Tax=Ornithorhynchus anatinus TaxID=9258 RepID=UPI0010A7BD9F|nr:centrosomal protein of 112 kDa isoform X7 [Ornithorhynchus anatinus]
MGSEEEKWEKLDAEFDHFVVDMKPYVLKLVHRSERQRCALWIKKLCEPSGVGTGIMGRKNRNLYAKLLLHMLKRGVVEGPFTHRPEPGSLKNLPSYMSIYFDEPNTARAKSSSPEVLPGWVVDELGPSEPKLDESWKYSSGEESTKAVSPNVAQSKRRCAGQLRMRSHSMSPTHRTEEENVAIQMSGNHPQNSPVSLDKSDIEARLSNWNLGLENPRYLREKPIPISLMTPKLGLRKSSGFCDDQLSFRMYEKELEMKTKIMEAKFHEEKLQLQQKHDTDIQKILGRKNNETEELKAFYKTKQNEAEDAIRKLEKKVQTLVRDSQMVREAKEIQIVELKKLCERSTESLNNDWEKKLHNVVAEMEKDKIELQKRHTENIQDLLEDTNLRLSKMEAEYLAQTTATLSEWRRVFKWGVFKRPSSTVENGVDGLEPPVKNQVVKDLEARVQQLTGEAENSNSQRQKLCLEKTELEKSYQVTCSELQEVKARCNSLHKERDHIIQDYEKNIKLLQSRYDADMQLLRQDQVLSAAKATDLIDELEQSVSQLKQQLQDSEHQRKQQLRDQENKFQQEKLHLDHAYEEKVQNFLSDRDKEKGDAQKKIHKLEEAVKEKEEQLTRVTEIQKLQAQQADSALEEFKRHVELNSEKVYAEMKQQMQKVETDLSRSKSLREKQSKEFLWQLEEVRQRYEQQIICDMETQNQKLREELVQLNSQRKQQLVELGLLREEEKQRAARDHESAISRLKAESEKKKLELKRAHAAETEVALEKANSRLKQIEKDYNQKLTKSSQIITELQTSLASLREESSRQQLASERRLQDVVQKLDDEKKQLIKDNDRAIKALQDKLENYSSQVRMTEKKLHHKELESQEQMICIRQEYESKLKGLIPASVRQELEDTISSLKSQVNFLQKRASVLQEELNAYRSRR